MKKIFTLIAFVSLSGILSAQDTQLTIENQSVSGTDFFFDIYLTRTSAGNELYLADSDFVISFDNANFTNPTLENFPAGTYEGNCTFIPTNATSGNISRCREDYHGGTAPTILGNLLVINLSVPVPTSQLNFERRIAKIDNVTTYRLGSFKVSGISNSSGFANLQWVTSGGNQTQVFTHATTTPWATTQVNITATNPSNFALPVTLTDISATPNTQSILVDWKSENEVNLSGYEVQRSTDGSNFSKIAFVDAKGGEASESYRYEDKDVHAGIIYYYRLKMIDYDDSFEFSPVRSAKIKGAVIDELTISPNPAKDFAYLDFNAPREGSYVLELFNETGGSIFQKNYDLNEGSNSIMLSTGQFSPGSYVVKIKMGEEVISGKLITAGK